MKVTMIAPFAIYPKGTVSVRMLPIAKELVEKGHQVSIVIPPYDNPANSGLEYEVDGIKITNVVFQDFKIIKYGLTSLRIIRKIFCFSPNIVYVFKPKGYSGLVAIFFAMLKRFGFLKRYQIILDMDDWEGYGGFNDYYLKHSLYPRIMLNFFDFQERWIPSRMDAITVASKTLEKRAQQLGVSPDKILYVPNGIESKKSVVKSNNIKFFKKKLGLENNQVILLYTRFFEYDVSKIVEILKGIKKQLSNVKLLVVGKGEFGEEEALKDLALREGIRDSFVFAGWIKPLDLPKYLTIGDVAIYPFKDTLLNRAKCPGKLVELMLAGKAIVADRVGQIAEYIEDNQSGLLVDSKDVNSFSSNVVKVLKDETLKKQLGENAKKRIITDFNWADLSKGIEKKLLETSMGI